MHGLNRLRYTRVISTLLPSPTRPAGTDPTANCARRLPPPRALLSLVVEVVPADRDPPPVPVSDPFELGGVLGQTAGIPDQHEVRQTGRHVGKNLTASPGGADTDRDLRDRANRHHTSTVTPILQLPDLPLKVVAAVSPSVENCGPRHGASLGGAWCYAEGPRTCPEPSQGDRVPSSGPLAPQGTRRNPRVSTSRSPGCRRTAGMCRDAADPCPHQPLHRCGPRLSIPLSRSMCTNFFRGRSARAGEQSPVTPRCLAAA